MLRMKDRIQMCEPDKRNLTAIWKHWAINNEQAKKLLFLSLLRSLPQRRACIFFKVIKTLPKTTYHQIIKYVQVVPNFQRCSILKFP